MDYFYGICLKILSARSILPETGSFKFFICIITELIFIAQNIQFFWYPGLPVSGWEKYEPFWNIINRPSFDVIIAYVDLIPEFIIFEIIMICTIALAIFAIILLKFFNKDPPELLLIISKLFWTIMSEILFIPTCILFFVIAKYSKNPAPIVLEYPNNLKGSKVDFGPYYGVLLSSGIIALLFSLTCVYECCHYEIRHFNNQIFSTAKVSPKTSILTKIIYALNCYCFISIQLSYYSDYLYLGFASYFLLTIYIFYSIPYYSYLMNYIKLFTHVDLSLICLFFIASYKIENAGISLLLTLVMQPALLIITHIVLTERYARIKPYQEVQSSKFKDFEISIRKHLRSGDLSEEILNLMNQNYKYEKNKMNLILQGYYCYDFLANPLLALNKVVYTQYSGMNFVDNFQVFKCKQILANNCEIFSSSYRLLQYFIDFSDVKKEDRKFCEDLLKFFRFITGPKPNLQVAKKLTLKISEKIREINNKYSSLLQRFPDSIEVKAMYGSLLANLLANREKGISLLGQIHNFNYGSKKFGISGMNFNEDRCYLVVSGDILTLGKPLYYNEKLLPFLCYPEETLPTLTLMQLLPNAIVSDQSSFLIRFVRSCTSHVMINESHVFFLDASGFICETITTIECVGNQDSLYFLCTIDPISMSDLEYALINQSGYIYEHSRNLPILLNSESKFIKEKYIQEFLPEIDIESLSSRLKYISDKRSCKLKAAVRSVDFLNKSFLVIYISKISDEDMTIICESKGFLEENFFSMYQESNIIKKAKRNQRAKLEKEVEFKLPVEKSADKPKVESSSSFKKELSVNEALIFKKSVVVLKSLKVLFFIALILLIASIIGILIYTSQEVIHFKNITSLESINKLVHSVSELGFMTRSFDIERKTNANYTYSIQDIYNLRDTIKEFKIKLMSDHENLSECKSSSILTEAEFSFWNFDKIPIRTSESFYKIIDHIIENLGLITEDIISRIEYDEHLFVIVFNCMGPAAQKAKLAIVGLLDCEMSRINNLESVKTILLLFGISLISITIALLSLYLMLINKYLNKLWNHLKKRAVTVSPLFTQVVVERIVDKHNEVNYAENDQHAGKYNTKKIEFKYSLSYLLRLSVILILGSVFYAISIEVFLDNIRKYLVYKPVFISNLYEKQNQLIDLKFLIQEVMIVDRKYSLENTFPFLDVFKSPNETLSDLVEKISKGQDLYKDMTKMRLASDSIAMQLKESVKNSSVFISTGIIQGINYITQESSYLLQSSYSLSQINKMYSMCNETNNLLEIVINEIVSESAKTIDLKLNQLIYFSVFCSGLLVLMFFILYVPYFNKEIKIVEDIIRIIPLLMQN